MPLRVTFDTNTLADVVSPEASQQPTNPADAARVRAAIQSGKFQGVICETLITLEGVKNADRSAVFGSTSTKARNWHETAPDGNGVTYINLCGAVSPSGLRPKAGRSIFSRLWSWNEIARRSEDSNGPGR
jgi:hypothetical protein